MSHLPYALIFLGLCSASGDPCPRPCDCRPDHVDCRRCPGDYLTVAGPLTTLVLDGCQDVEYLLRLHAAVERLCIRNAQVRQPEMYIYADVGELVLSNDSINALVKSDRSSNLTKLDLSHNAIEILDAGVFKGLRRLVELDLSDNRIATAADGCFDGLADLLRLDLSSNGIASPDTIFQPLTSLQLLNLSSNHIEALSERSFGGLPALRQLDISRNRLTAVAPGTLQFLPNLAGLAMTDNPGLRPEIFVGTGGRLQRVDASRTGLSRVPEALTHSVRYLTLAGNRIAHVRCGDLDGYPLLRMLDFSHNIIADVEDDALGRLEMLTILHLDSNRLRAVPKMLSDGLTYLSLDDNLISNLTITDFASGSGLKTLILSNNDIAFIQENSFAALVSLEALDLSNNPLTALTPNTFAGPLLLKELTLSRVNASLPAEDMSFPVASPERIESLHLQYSPGLARQLMADTAALAAMGRLRQLDLRHSNLTVLRSDLVHFLPALKVLRLEGNRLDCDRLGWLAEWMKENPADDYDQVKCDTPPTLAGTLVRDLNISIATTVATTELLILSESSAEPNATLIAVSELRTSRLFKEPNRGGFEALAVAAILIVVGAALAVAWTSRRRPQRQDLMEVPTIAAVGELW